MVEGTNAALLSVRDLHAYFGSASAPIRAVAGVSLDIGVGQTVALVGESGCGKSVTALSFCRLNPEPPAYYPAGKVLFDGQDVLRLSAHALRALRGSRIAYVFQNPATSLNPVFRVGNQLGEAIRLHRRGAAAQAESIRLLEMVGLPDPPARMRAYPHELSGGMQQRVMIAMALACEPDLLVADEPTTALDVTIQAQILELLRALQERMRMSILLITHNFGLVADVAHRVYVMYAGRVVESGETERILSRPAHPYTKALLAAVPRLEGGSGRMAGIKGAVPHPGRLPAGCTFHPRCPKAQARCSAEEPVLEPAEEGQFVRCHFWR